METLYSKLILPGLEGPVGTGWLPPRPDLRDYTEDSPMIKPMLAKLGLSSGNEEKVTAVKGKASAGLKQKPATSVDLRQWCSPIENQQSIGSCTAQAAIGIVEYFEKRAYNRHIDGSRMFLYKVTRNLMQTTGDTGAWLRNVMGALALCGVPDEKYWPYKIEDFDKEPDAFIYSVADNYEAIKYFCHDPQGANIPTTKVLESVKKYLEAGIPSMFGFWGFSSFDNADVKGGIPYPSPNESAEWGHAIVAVGYDDKIKIKNLKSGYVSTGALLIRNSWGTSWGDKGYGWLPYDYVYNDLATDFWSLLEMGWVDSRQFGK